MEVLFLALILFGFLIFSFGKMPVRDIDGKASRAARAVSDSPNGLQLASGNKVANESGQQDGGVIPDNNPRTTKKIQVAKSGVENAAYAGEAMTKSKTNTAEISQKSVSGTGEKGSTG